jgi:hypothetical protein
MNKVMTSVLMVALLVLLASATTSCGASGLANQLGQLGGSLDDDGTPDQGPGDFGVGGSGGGNSQDDDGTPDQGSGDAPGTPGSGSTDDDGTADQGRGDRGDDRNDDDDNSGRR